MFLIEGYFDFFKEKTVFFYPDPNPVPGKQNWSPKKEKMKTFHAFQSEFCRDSKYDLFEIVRIKGRKNLDLDLNPDPDWIRISQTCIRIQI